MRLEERQNRHDNECGTSPTERLRKRFLSENDHFITTPEHIPLAEKAWPDSFPWVETQKLRIFFWGLSARATAYFAPMEAPLTFSMFG